eukprot:TRINITY_DN2378_c0_g1_i2.p1 TRINITY_DN2378_c0_g1~~TRINITY_DN2378_c0_g1_i2.p1  ORF type:complete len:388 (-),score=6.86 TRINITY_DN2378_c0_g1_i2:20-1183(-)
MSTKRVLVYSNLPAGAGVNRSIVPSSSPLTMIRQARVAFVGFERQRLPGGAAPGKKCLGGRVPGGQGVLLESEAGQVRGVVGDDDDDDFMSPKRLSPMCALVCSKMKAAPVPFAVLVVARSSFRPSPSRSTHCTEKNGAPSAPSITCTATPAPPSHALHARPAVHAQIASCHFPKNCAATTSAAPSPLRSVTAKATPGPCVRRQRPLRPRLGSRHGRLLQIDQAGRGPWRKDSRGTSLHGRSGCPAGRPRPHPPMPSGGRRIPPAASTTRASGPPPPLPPSRCTSPPPPVAYAGLTKNPLADSTDAPPAATAPAGANVVRSNAGPPGTAVKPNSATAGCCTANSATRRSVGAPRASAAAAARAQTARRIAFFRKRPSPPENACGCGN